MVPEYTSLMDSSSTFDVGLSMYMSSVFNVYSVTNTPKLDVYSVTETSTFDASSEVETSFIFYDSSVMETSIFDVY